MQTRNSKGVETCNSHIYFFPMLLNIHLQGTIFGTEKKRSIWPIKFDGYENDTEKVNRPFLSSPGLCIKTRLGAQPLVWKGFFFLRQIKLISTRKVVHLASFWQWGFLELGRGLFALLKTCIALIPSSSFRRMLAISKFFRNWILKTVLKFRKRNRKSLSCVFASQRMLN